MTDRLLVITDCIECSNFGFNIANDNGMCWVCDGRYIERPDNLNSEDCFTPEWCPLPKIERDN